VTKLSDRNTSPLSKKQHAVALRYSEVTELPQVVASGSGELARRIVELALEHKVPIMEDTLLTELLGTLGPGSPIGEESFQLVAEIISFLYHSDREWQRDHTFLDPVMQAPLPLEEEGEAEASDESPLDSALRLLVDLESK
jgi:flagellar biosynthesis protein